MDIISGIFRLIGIAGVVVIVVGLLGYGVFWALTRWLDSLEETVSDDDPGYDPDPPNGEITTIKNPDALEVSGFSFAI